MSTQNLPNWLDRAVFYQIFPERFANGDPGNDPPGALPWGSAGPTRDNFFGGDLLGVIDHLDHILDVGANALYLTPIFQADTNHRYDTVDYKRVDPYLGDLDTFRRLVREAHDRGIRVVLDAVFNHCGAGHPAFRDVVERGARSPYVNWFYVEDLPVRAEPEPNYATCGGAVYLPKWNVHNPQVRDHLFEVTRRWTEEGIDGWRLDVPYLMNQNFWRRFRQLVKGIDENLYIVAEIWGEATEWVRGDIADGAMNYPLRDLILGFVADGTLTARDFADGVSALARALPGSATPAMLNLLGSHDTERLFTRCGRDVTRLRQALALLVTSPGIPMIYYGDEVGLTGEIDPGCRACMPWDRDSWNTEIMDITRTALRLRARHPVLASGADTILHADETLLLRRRGSGADAVLVGVNTADRPREIPPALLSGDCYVTLAFSGQNESPSTVIPAHGVVVLGSEPGPGGRTEHRCGRG